MEPPIQALLLPSSCNTPTCFKPLQFHLLRPQKNGKLEVYEESRQPIETRLENLLRQALHELEHLLDLEKKLAGSER